MANQRIRVLFQKDFFTFDYSKFVYPPRGDYLDVVRHYYAKFINPFVALFAVAAYLVLSKPMCDFIRFLFGQKKGENGPIWSTFLKYFTLLHSLLLAVYSGWTFYNTFNIAMTATLANQAANPTMSWMSAFMYTNCDWNGDFWNKYDFQTWVFHFYLSKFYEFIDTWIILLKDRKPMFLQTFHHAGIVILMWSFLVTNNSAMGICVTVLNSFIHTIMYLYYAFAAIGIKLPFKQVITSLQITQFFTGIIYSTPNYWMENCHTDGTWWTQLYANAYTLVLIGLFGMFAYSEYVAKPKKARLDKKGKDL